MCRLASCCRPTLTATFRCLSRRWSSRAKAAPSISPAALTNRVAPAEGIARAVQAGIPLARVTLSSDGNGSQPFFDDEGNLTHIGVAGFETLLETVQVLVKDYDFSISDALRPLTSSVAGFLNLNGKGEILPGNDADLMVMTPELRIEQVSLRGKLMVKDGKACVKGTFETA